MTSDMRSGSNLVGALLESRYRIDAQIARGGMSTVYRGLDTRLDRPVAIKVMDTQYSGDRSFVERFEREARAAASLHHPSVVAVYDQGVDSSADGDHVFLVMQLVEGCTLRDLILDAGGQLQLPVALAVIEPVLSALAVAHDAGMVHRDVKPENVLIGTDGSIKVADFGLVRAAASAGTTSGSVILGTVAYLSPEQVTTGAADARTDVYAAGIVLYEMLTGQPPYVGDTAMSVAYRHVNDDVPPPGELATDLPAAIDDLVVRATRRDEQQRPADARALLTELEQVRTDLGIALPTVQAPAAAVPEATQHDAADEPSTTQLPAVGGPQGTRAMQRPTTDDDSTQELAAVSAGPAPARPERGGKRRMVLWTTAVIVLAALIGGAAFWLGSGRYEDVPPVVGEQEQQAQEMLSGVGLTGQVTREYNDEVPEGVVISAAPGPGDQVSTNNSVDLVVSQGKPRVPDISEGATVAETESALRDARLAPKRDEAADKFHTSVPEGRVIGVNPPPGTPLNSSSEVTLAVSKGPPPVPVPDVRGMGREEAFAQLSAAGFEPVDGERRFDSDVPGDHVIATDPSGGTEVRLQGRPQINVVLSNAVQVPDLNGSEVEDAQRVMAERGLRLEVQAIFDRPNARIFGQLPLPGGNVEPDSVVRVTAF